VSSLEPWREQIVAWRSEGIQGTTIHAALVRRYGYGGSDSAVHRFLKPLPLTQPDVPLRLYFQPGEAAPVDFGAGPVITDVRTGEFFKTWVFVMTLCGSRHQYAEVVRDQTTATGLACHRRAFEAFGGVVGRVIIDNPQCAITRACYDDPEVQWAYADCAEGYGFRDIARVLKPGGVFLFKTPNKTHSMPTLARLTPHRFHPFVNRLRGRVEADAFPTRYEVLIFKF